MSALTRSAPFWLILPSLALALFIIGYPVYDLVMASTHDVSRFGMLRDFTGLANFADLFDDPLFWGSLARTGIWTVAVVVGTILISLPVAIILNDDFAGRGLARVIVMLPWAISLAMTAIVWRWALEGELGMLNATLIRLGLMGTPVIWLSEAWLAFPWQIAIGILVSIPFTVTVFLGGLSSIPNELQEAARVDGASEWSIFRSITLPLMRPFMNIAVVLNVIYVFNSFPIIWVTTGGGPANQTDILVTYLYKLAFRFGHMGKAAAMSLIMFILLLIVTIAYVRMVMRHEQKN